MWSLETWVAGSDDAEQPQEGEASMMGAGDGGAPAGNQGQEGGEAGMQARARLVWQERGRRECLAERYAPLMPGLSEAGRTLLDDAVNMRSTSKKHLCMHVELTYMLAAGIIVHCDEQGSESPFGGGARVVEEPRVRGAQCSFGGWTGLWVRPERAREFLERWAGLHEMHICPDIVAFGSCPLARCAERRAGPVDRRLQPHAQGLGRRDWITLTENMSNQAHRFGLVPLPVGRGSGGGRETWTAAFTGQTPLVYRPPVARTPSQG